MTAEPHPYPERTFWRIGPPVAAAVLAAVLFAVMFGVLTGPALMATMIVALVMQFALMGGRGLYLRRSARLADRPVHWHQFWFAWSFYAGAAYLLSGDHSLDAAALHVGSGLPFAVFFVVVLGLNDRSRGRRHEGSPP